ncbi:MAG: YggS family pyridoxal phosphate-dependent enzyme [Endomicrobium sp.]|jgi:pyridoxal phosphate enzyme (YggS family)|nr:YggS family pyridoxal phosphate-dependent enzyme [Endomicrobium sp.]
MRNIRENIKFIKDVVNLTKSSSGLVELVVVTKTFPYQSVLEALECGITHVGESKVQEALPKFEQLGLSLKGITKHFIGRLQSNKVRKVVENFDLIHSLDTINLAYNISRHAKNLNKLQNCLIEVKVSREIYKIGIAPDEVGDFYKKCLSIPNIFIKGLMVITPFSKGSEGSRYYFKQVYELFRNIKKSFNDPEFDVLSMGMSSDYKVAIEEGSNMIRVGSAIFGEREYGNE